jgi:hypothetical protein
MDLVQEQTFKYFFDFAEPNSGMALERSNGSSTLVTTGGTGFGIAAFPAAVERGWIAEQQAMQRLQRILSFLEIVPTYHGAFSHWYDGSSAATIPFSDLDNGGDLVETAFLMQGLLINRQYFDANTTMNKIFVNELQRFGKRWSGPGMNGIKTCLPGTGRPNSVLK